MATIVIIRGDGIGPEVVEEGLKVLKAAARKVSLALEFQEALLGGAAIDATGDPLPEETRPQPRAKRAAASYSRMFRLSSLPAPYMGASQPTR